MLTDEQKTIVNQVPDFNTIVNATAGSGKTSTLVAMVNGILKKNSNARILVICFNKHIATEINEKVKGNFVVVSTLHSMGNALLKAYPNRFTFNKYLMDNPDKKYVKIIKDLVGFSQTSKIVRNNAKTMLDLGRMLNINFDDSTALYNLAVNYQIPIVGEEISVVSQAAEIGKQQFLQKKWADFGDMIYLPNVLDLDFPATGIQVGGKSGVTIEKPFDYVIADEAQDFGITMQLLVKRFGHKNTKFIFFGDRNQAINGYCGSDPYSFDNLTDMYDCQNLELTMTFRLPKNHTEHVNNLFGLNCNSFKDYNGDLEEISFLDYEKLNPSYTILGRFRNGKEARLWDILFNCLSLGIDTSIYGMDVFGLCDKIITEEIQDKPFNKAVDLLTDHINATVAGFTQKNWKSIAEDYQKDAQIVIRLIESSDKNNWEDFNKFLSKISYNRKNCVQLSTIHTYKGGENENVILLDANKFPYVTEKTSDIQKIQERCVHYVALTRSQHNLYFLNTATL